MRPLFHSMRKCESSDEASLLMLVVVAFRSSRDGQPRSPEAKTV